jgi:hypothetical protein
MQVYVNIMIYSFYLAEYVSNSKAKESNLYWILPKIILTLICPIHSWEMTSRASCPLQDQSWKTGHPKDLIPVPAMLNAVVLVSYMDILWQETEYNGSLLKSGVGFAVAFFWLAYLVMKSNFHN